MLCGTAVLADADAKSASEKGTALFRQFIETFQDDEYFSLDPSIPEPLRLYGKITPFAMYIFPDNENSGTLEQILLDGARHRYPALLTEAEKYIACVEPLPDARKLAAGSNKDTAAVGVVSNVLRPGRANQVSIHDDDWFTAESLAALPSHRALSAFADMIISWGTI